MNWTRKIRSLYRKEPITGFMLTIGLVDAIIGGTSGYQTLLAIGLGTVGLAIGVRWKLMQQIRQEPIQPQPKSQSRHARYLLDSDAHLATIDVDARKV
ncbi:hypothetical protein NDI45_21090 [Leptolyngbya sp. GB1-A1]|uniref:hypothetical protein n=1 Tax=Leptolyngbya sp. GB1-A1 TaxID=2933908 RepID=UPI00329833D1